MSGDDSGEWLDSYDDFKKVEKHQDNGIELDELHMDVDDDLEIDLDEIELSGIGEDTENTREFDYYPDEEEKIQKTSLFQERFVLVAIVAVIFILVTFVGIGAALYYTQDDSNAIEENDNGTLKIHDRTVLLISLDGYRYEYFQEESLDDVRTNLDAIASAGAFTPMRPVFPAVTYPNHWSIVTGLYAESHGIIENYIYDPATNKSFSIFDETVNDASWYGGEAMWETYSKYGGISASVFWPGSELEERGTKYSLPYDGSMSYESRVNQIIEWMELPDETRPRFITLYLNAVDSAGHEAGPYSQEVRNAIKQVDDAIGLLVSEVKKLKIAETVNYLLVSDHGMTDVQQENVIFLDDYINIIDDAKVITWGPLASIWGLHNRAAQLNYQLKDLQNATVYLRENIPKEFHYTNSSVIPDLIIVADEGWFLSAHNREDYKVGDHGYDPNLPSMASFLIGKGDYFNSGFVSDTQLENIHLYSLMSRMLNVLGAPNNGSWISLCPLLNEQC